MKLMEQLRKPSAQKNWEEICDYCIKRPEHIRQLVDLCTSTETKVQQNASAVLGKLIDQDKNILNPYLIELPSLLKADTHDAVNRAVLRIFQFAAIPEEIEGELFEYITTALKSADQPIAVKAFGMTVGRKICEKYPELANELIPLIEILIEEKVSAGIVNRGKKEIDKLKSLI